MHELGLLIQTAETVQAAAAEHGIDVVQSITIDIGEASGALPDIFTELFPMVQEQYPVLAHAVLELHTVRSEALCSNCHAVYDLIRREGKCPRCGSRDKTVLGGQDVRIRELRY